MLYVIDGNRRHAEATARSRGNKQGTFKYVTKPEDLADARPRRDALAIGAHASKHPVYTEIIEEARRVGFDV